MFETKISPFADHLHRAVVAVIVVAAMLSATIPAFGQAQILDIHEGLPDVDNRTGAVSPNSTQKSIVANMGASVTWNRFGTPQSLIKHRGYLATGLSGSPVQVARNWIGQNKALFRLSDQGVANLELLNEAKLPGSNAYVILFRQRFGGLPAAQDGMITVGVVGGKIAYVSSSAVGDKAAPGAPAISAAEAWLRAAQDVGRLVTAAEIKGVREESGWNLLDVAGFSHPQRARLIAFPTPKNGVRPAYETIVLDVKGGSATAYTHFIDAQTGEVLFRQNRVNQFAAPQTHTFTGSFNPPTPSTCGPAHGPYTAGPDTKSIDVIATADNPVNDIVLRLYFGQPGVGGTVVASQDTGTSPEAIHYTGSGGIVPAGDYYVEVCLFNDPTVAPAPPYSYTGNITINDVAGGGQVVPYPPMWKFFTANPLLSPTGAPSFDYPDDDIRILGCWEASLNGISVPGCDLELFNLASRAPWDVDVRLNAPTFTTKGNNANAAEAWTAPLTPGAFGFRPVSPDREYVFPWTNAWENSKCSPANFVPGVGNDISAAVTSLFANHNRMHDWSYFLGFTERTWNLQESNFGNRATGGVVNNVNGGENDPETGQAQAGAVDGGAPSYLGRDNANQITLNDGIPGITNMYLWQPIASAFYAPCVDGDYDQSVIGHEYTHAISNRMVGGPDANLTGAQAGAMGESWSDLTAVEYLNGWVATLQDPFDFPVDGENPFAVGPYVTGNLERGIRNYGMNRNKVLPFKNSFGLNPLNYSDIGYDLTGPQVHADGEIWSAANYDIRQALVTKYNSKFPAADKTLQRRCADGELPADQCPGNRRWMQIVFDAYLLMQPAVSMLDARDAYLAADMMRFGGANQRELWRVFAQRGMGEFAHSNTTNDPQPIPNFETLAEANEATAKFVVRDEGGNPVKARIFVGHYEAGATQIADTDPNTTVNNADTTTKINSDTAKFVPGKYDLLVQAQGYGHLRFERSFGANQSVELAITMPTNLASKFKGATAAGDGFFHDNLIDDSEELGWAANNRQPDVGGTRVTVDLAGGAHVIRRVQVSAMIRPSDPSTAPDGSSLSRNRFVALRQFEVWTCTEGANLLNLNCLNSIDAGFTKIYTSPDDAFPGVAPRPAAPDLILREFAVPSTTATHVQLRVVANQCTGGPQFQGDQDNDPLNNSDCRTGSASDNTVRAQEFQVFGQKAAAPATDPVVAVTMSAPATAVRGSEITYEISYNNLGPYPSSNAVVTDVLPKDLDFVSAAGGVFDPVTRKVTWKLGTVAVNAPGKLKLVARVRSTVAPGTAIVNQAEYTADLTVSTPAAAVTLIN
jgi:extracellular elastinolytic metalloproteinase